MAKRKRRREKKENNELMIELYSIILIISAILGIGKLGPVGRMISSFSLFLTGSWTLKEKSPFASVCVAEMLRLSGEISTTVAITTGPSVAWNT